MKKLSKNVMIFVLGILVAFTIDVAAETLISSEGVSYSNSRTNETTVSGALDELFSAIEISKQIGDMNLISSIGDGTITGAISTINKNLNNIISADISPISMEMDNTNTDVLIAYPNSISYMVRNGICYVEISNIGVSNIASTSVGVFVGNLPTPALGSVRGMLRGAAAGGYLGGTYVDSIGNFYLYIPNENKGLYGVGSFSYPIAMNN